MMKMVISEVNPLQGCPKFSNHPLHKGYFCQVTRLWQHGNYQLKALLLEPSNLQAIEIMSKYVKNLN